MVDGSAPIDWTTIETDVITIQTTPLDGGIVSQVARIELAYDAVKSDVPKSLIAKLGPNGSMYYEHFGRREISFYRLLADDISMATPSCYYADVNASEKKVVLLLEDVRPSVATDWKTGCTLN